MKKILLLFILFATFQTQAQTYTPFPEDVAVWDLYLRPSESDTHHQRFKRHIMKGDTVINNITYNKIYSFSYSRTSPVTPLTLTKFDAFGIRQDIAKKKVYRTCVVNNQTIDTLLYDYDLKIGDTVPKTFTTGDMTHLNQTVSSIDSIQFHGKHYRRFKLNTTGLHSAALIEGVGSANGLIEPHYGFFEAGHELIDFCNSEHSDCTIPLALDISETDKDPLQASIYPNPFSDKLTIVFNEDNGKYIVTLTDLLGKEIRKFDFAGKEFSIPKDQLKNGIYFLKINSQHTALVQKIIVE